MSEYEHYCLFGESWWLDTVCGRNGWDEIRVVKGGQLQARLPYVKCREYGLITLGMPPLTQCLGPYFKPSLAKYPEELSRQKNFVNELISRLPFHHVFLQNFHHASFNWLPWYWQGFEQTTRYTYILEDLNRENVLWNGLQPNIRREIRKAINRFKLRVRTDLGPDVLFRVCQKTFQRQHINGLQKEIVRRIYNACEKRGSGRAFFAVDKLERVHAAAYLIWDERTAYYLLGGGDPQLRNSGAHSLIIWEAIKHAASVSRTFDFEGSMIESVERFFRAFGARQTPYHHIKRFNNRYLRAGMLFGKSIKTILKG